MYRGKKCHSLLKKTHSCKNCKRTCILNIVKRFCNVCTLLHMEDKDQLHVRMHVFLYGLHIIYIIGFMSSEHIIGLMSSERNRNSTT